MDTKRLFGLSEQQTARLIRSGPSFVKSANATSNDTRSPKYYADDFHKQFPIDTPTNVWLSAAGLEKNANTIPAVRYRSVKAAIDKAAEIFGITKEVNALRAQLSAPPDDTPQHFAVTVTTSDGRVKKLYPLRTALEVKKAAEYFVKYRHEMPWSVRNMFATNVLARAQDLGADIANERSLLLKSACGGISAKKDVLDELRRRIKWAEDTSGEQAARIREELVKLANTVEREPSAVFSSRVSIVELLDTMDRKFGWNRYYSRTGLPEDSFFAVTSDDLAMFKKAVVENHHAGYLYDFADVVNIPRESLEAALGRDVVRRMSDDFGGLDAARMSAVLKAPVGELFHKVAAAHGVKPFARITRAEGLPPEARHFLASSRDKSKRASLWDRLEACV